MTSQTMCIRSSMPVNTYKRESTGWSDSVIRWTSLVSGKHQTIYLRGYVQELSATVEQTASNLWNNDVDFIHPPEPAHICRTCSLHGKPTCVAKMADKRSWTYHSHHLGFYENRVVQPLFVSRWMRNGPSQQPAPWHNLRMPGIDVLLQFIFPVNSIKTFIESWKPTLSCNVNATRITD